VTALLLMLRTRPARVALAVAFAAGAFVVWPRPEQVTRENRNRVQEGMSLTEVEAILGSTGDFRTGPTRPRMDISPPPAHAGVKVIG
jgi:hypothetical protein